MHIPTGKKSLHKNHQSIPLLILVRHGECISHAKDRLFGQLDLPLDPVGQFQLERCGQILSYIISKILLYKGKFKSFISSDLLRCVESASIIQQVIKREIGLQSHVFTTPRLREYHLGNWENQKLSHVYDEVIEYIDDFKRNQYNAKPPGILAESQKMMYSRVEPLTRYFYDFLLKEPLDTFAQPSQEAQFENWLKYHSETGVTFEIHLWVVHEGSSRMILDCLNIESWTPDMEAEFLHDKHQKFFQRGDILLLAPHFDRAHHIKRSALGKSAKQHGNYSIYFHYKSSSYTQNNFSKDYLAA